MTTAPSGRLQNTPSAYLPAMLAQRRQPTGWRRLASSKGVRNGFLDGYLKGACLAVKLLDHAGQFVARMILFPQVGYGCIAHIALRLPGALVNTGSFDEQPRQTSATPCIPGDFDSVLLTGTYIRRRRRGLRRL